jgi:hypothetical protein
VTLIIGHGNQSTAQQLVQALKADPTSVLYDEKGEVYKAFSLERVFLSLIQESAALVIDKQGVVRFALKTNNAMRWLDPRRLKQLETTLEQLDRDST